MSAEGQAFEGYVAQAQGTGLHMDGTTPVVLRVRAPSGTFTKGMKVVVLVAYQDVHMEFEDA